VNKY